MNQQQKQAMDMLVRVRSFIDSTIPTVRPFEALFVTNGLPADFLAQFGSARNTPERMMSVRAAQVVLHTVAGAGLKVQRMRGRRARATVVPDVARAA